MNDASGGLVVVDKPSDWTSHDVVARLRRAFETRRVGHAGTLDPMATGVLLVGIGRATRMLGHLSGASKDYRATIRLGQTTLTDDAQGELLVERDASGIGHDALEAALASLTGDIMQIPSSVSAIKVNGVRSYARVRSGEEVKLPPRPVRVDRFAMVGPPRPSGTVVDLDVDVSCSSGTYVRALARDVGERLNCGGHLTALRRTRVSGFGLEHAHSLDQVLEDPLAALLDIDEVARLSFDAAHLTEAQALDVRFGRRLYDLELPSDAVHAVFDADGRFLALYQRAEDCAKPVAVFV